MAMRLGDHTARNLGRLTLNPLKHLDPVGTLCMIFFHFGWARPVPINSRYFKKPRRDMALTALAGPVSNIIMGALGILLYCIFYRIFSSHMAEGFLFNVQLSVLTLLMYFYQLNISLAVFNLLPVPPLDGSRIFLTFLPPRYYFGIMQYERYIQFGLMLLLYLGFLNTPLSFLRNLLINGIFRLVELLPFI
ncbi:MAG: site-2 protease family protein [Clostridia bacterium]|nr:site-2 protease family protein [Clostridia bacterium]